MKRFLLYLLTIAAFVACSKGEDEGNDNSEPTPEKPKTEIKIDTSTSDFTTEGGDNTISFTTNEAWTAQVINSRADDWCKIHPTSGAAGNATITVTTTPNDTPDDRTASIIIKAGAVSKTVTVSQKQKDALTITASKFEVAAAGGEVAIEVKANIDFEYVIDDDAKEWISYEGTRALKTSKLAFKIAENDDIEKREGQIFIKNGELVEAVTIYQDGAEPSIVISKNEYVVSSDGETISVEVKSNVDVAIELTAEADWISENTSRATSTNTYRFDISPNESYDQRSAEIKFTNKENNLSEVVTIKQMQKDAIVLAKSEYEFGIDGGNLDFEIQTNVDVTVTISDNAKDWIQQIESRALETKKLFFNVAVCSTEEDREGTITISGGSATQTITVKQSGLKEILEKEREALIAFYNALDGDNWKSIWGHTDIKNENWCSDRPVYEWYGVRLNNKGNVVELRLPGCNLSGKIPPEIKYLSELEALQLNNNIVGELPRELFELKKLKSLVLMTNWLSGEIPEEIGNLTNLKELELDQNSFTGAIPESLIKLTELETLKLTENPLSGSLPDSFYNWEFWGHWWGLSLDDTKYRFEDIKLPGPKATITCFDGKILNLQDEYKKNKYTILFQWSSLAWETVEILPQLKKIHDLYANKGVKIIGWANSNDETKDSAIKYIGESEILWDNFYYNYSDFNFTHNYDNLENTFGTLPGYPSKYVTSITVVDSTGKIVFSDLFGNRDKVYRKDGYFISLLESDFEYDIENLYESTDFSQDGKVVTLQKATKGNGIDIVLMGDAYSDRLVADGTYQKDMEYLYSQFFVEEPYKSFKDYFNVYYVVVVSNNEIYVDYSNTALDGYFGEGSLVRGNNNTCLTYAQKSLDDVKRLNEVTIVVSMNSDRYAGTCYMFFPVDYSQNWGNGVSISYFPKGGNAERFAQLLHHEACGHGFAKLADEYAYEYMGAIPESSVTSHQSQQANWGWWKNVDFTSDLTAVRWKHFINDTRYANEGLGAYEGGCTYWSGVWRPTENSIMRYNTGGFNAPSREAIYYRIHKLAYGEDWEYDYEKFVEWDAKNRKTAAATREVPYKSTSYKPTHPPVVINKSWRDAK